MGRHHINVYDNARSWILPRRVRANIPLRGSHGMLGAHNVARGLLVEICRHTGAVPLCLHYHEAAHRRGTLTIVTALAWGNDRFLLVTTRTLTDWRKPATTAGASASTATTFPTRIGTWRRRCQCRLPSSTAG